MEEELSINPTMWKRRTIARLITKVEEDSSRARNIINSILPFTGNAHVIGITGPPGCGKSTLIEKLALQIRRTRNKKVGIIAIDPSSPYSRGAFMGNRIRMSQSSQDVGIFIRSMASRESQGGLSASASAAVKILDAAGMDYIIIETVGAGQIQTDIAKVAHTVVIVLQPESGDIIQAMKAGLMEIGDVFAVNKSDLTGAAKTVKDLSEVLSMGHINTWAPKVVKIIATRNKGIAELAEAIEEHKGYLSSSGLLSRKKEEMARYDLRKIVEAEFQQMANESLNESGRALQKIIQDIVSKKISAYDAARMIMGSTRSRDALSGSKGA